ncbi:MAG: hypothetical protein K9G39_10815 [Chlorobium sp.]|uniref:hypothetical protein n=1 Tax=Chlorobium sp. TaxID=1095 RepID=UPI0025C03D1E|nr:hypothetical protein [Chlorobium sp.]MCF8384059.1 hypothetical protein [Chlorobium sp.]
MKKSIVRIIMLAAFAAGYAGSPLFAAVSGNMSDVSAQATVGGTVGSSVGPAVGSGLPGPDDDDGETIELQNQIKALKAEIENLKTALEDCRKQKQR